MDGERADGVGDFVAVLCDGLGQIGSRLSSAADHANNHAGIGGHGLVRFSVVDKFGVEPVHADFHRFPRLFLGTVVLRRNRRFLRILLGNVVLSRDERFPGRSVVRQLLGEAGEQTKRQRQKQRRKSFKA